MKKILPYILIVFFWLGLFLYSGTFTSGYHFIDDFEIITMKSKMEKSTFLYTAKTYILPDLTRRFRPFWALHRVTEVKIFGRDFRLWAAYTGLLCILTSMLLFAFAKSAGINAWLSLLFVFLTLTGPQSVIWYQYAHSENLGMFFMALSLFFLAKIIYKNKNNFLFKSLFVISLTITSLCKESFTLFIPSVLFLYVWLYSDSQRISLAGSFKRNKMLLIIPFAFSVICSVIIVIFIGTDKSLYAGVDNKILSPEFFSDIISTLSGMTSFWLMLTGLMLIYVNEYLSGKRKQGIQSGGYEQFSFTKPLAFFLLIYLPQFALYYKSGFHTRYYLPLMFGFSFVIIYAAEYISGLKFRPNIVKHIYAFLILLLILYNAYYYTVPDILAFDKERRATSSLLNFILENQKDDSETLTIMDPVHHWGFGKSFYLYSNHSGGKGKMTFKFIKLDTLIYPYTDSALYKSTESYTGKYFTGHHFDSAVNTKNIDFINIFPGLEEKFLSENNQWFEKEKYFRKSFDDFVIYYRK